MIDQLVADIGTLVEIESPSGDAAALQRSAEVLAELIEGRLGGSASLLDGAHVRWTGSQPAKILLLGHHDTVFPLGTLDRLPFRSENGRVHGPGVFDMKAGIVIAIHAVAALIAEGHHPPVEMLWTSDEEIGSWSSRELIAERARACGATLVFEPSADGGAAKVARKGTGTFEVLVRGRAAHAGLEPEKGINSLVAAAELIARIRTFGRPDLGTTVTPTMCFSGTADNTVPAETRLVVDARVSAAGEKERVESLMATLAAPPATVDVRGGISRPPMPRSAAEPLLPLLQQAATALGVEVGTAEVGGGSDGNFTAAAGIPTLDGLGAVGGGAHSDDEHVVVDTLPTRVALIAALLRRW